MKTSVLFCIFVFAGCSIISAAPKLPTTFSVGTKTYEGVRYKSHDAVRLTFFHDGGIGSVEISKLSPELQTALAFDAEKAAEATAQQNADSIKNAQLAEQNRRLAEAEKLRAEKIKTAESFHGRVIRVFNQYLVIEPLIPTGVAGASGSVGTGGGSATFLRPSGKLVLLEGFPRSAAEDERVSGRYYRDGSLSLPELDDRTFQLFRWAGEADQ